MQLIGTLKFSSPVNREYSSSAVMQPLGQHESTMELYQNEPNRYWIEWDIPTLEESYEIGIWCENGVLEDYDGLFSLPKQAIELLRAHGITVPGEFE